jgi:hypothetical protein
VENAAKVVITYQQAHGMGNVDYSSKDICFGLGIKTFIGLYVMKVFNMVL